MLPVLFSWSVCLHLPRFLLLCTGGRSFLVESFSFFLFPSNFSDREPLMMIAALAVHWFAVAPGREITADDTLALALIRAAPIFSSVMPWMWHEYTNTKSSYTQNSLLRKSSPVAVNIWCFDYKHNKKKIKKRDFVACTINKESTECCVPVHTIAFQSWHLHGNCKWNTLFGIYNFKKWNNYFHHKWLNSTTQWYWSRDRYNIDIVKLRCNIIETNMSLSSIGFSKIAGTKTIVMKNNGNIL